MNVLNYLVEKQNSDWFQTTGLTMKNMHSTNLTMIWNNDPNHFELNKMIDLNCLNILGKPINKFEVTIEEISVTRKILTIKIFVSSDVYVLKLHSKNDNNYKSFIFTKKTVEYSITDAKIKNLHIGNNEINDEANNVPEDNSNAEILSEKNIYNIYDGADYCTDEESWKKIYLEQNSNLSDSINLDSFNGNILRTIISLIIECCVEFNMMLAFQTVKFNENLMGVINKYRKRLIEDIRLIKGKYSQSSVADWNDLRGPIYEFNDVFNDNFFVKDKIKEIIMKEYSIDFDNDERKLMHLDRIILTFKEAFKNVYSR